MNVFPIFDISGFVEYQVNANFLEKKISLIFDDNFIAYSFFLSKFTHGLSGGVKVAQGSLEALVKVRILAGQPFY